MVGSDYIEDTPPRAASTGDRRWWFMIPTAAIVLGLGVAAGAAIFGSDDTPTVQVGEYSLDYQCEPADELMMVTGVIANNVDRQLDLRLNLAAVSQGEADPSIFRSYDMSLKPDERRDFRFPVTNAESVSIKIDDDYTCTASVSSP